MKCKQIFFMVFCLTFMTENIYSQERNTPINVVDKEFKILKIDSIENVYVIYAEQSDSVFQILSEKEDVCNCQKIELNNTYILSIKSYFLPETIYRQLTGVKYKGAVIKMVSIRDKTNVVRDLYLSDDIKGKCYIRKDKQ